MKLMVRNRSTSDVLILRQKKLYTHIIIVINNGDTTFTN